MAKLVVYAHNQFDEVKSMPQFQLEDHPPPPWSTEHAVPDINSTENESPPL